MPPRAVILAITSLRIVPVSLIPASPNALSISSSPAFESIFPSFSTLRFFCKPPILAAVFLISLAISLPAGPNLAAIESTCLLKSSKLPTLVMSPIFSCLPVALKLPCNTPVAELSPTLNRAIALSTASSLAKAAAVRRIAFRSRSLTSLVACV